MKRVGFIYEKIYDIENIKKAIMKASLGKRDKPYIKRIIDNIDYYAEIISDMLKNKTYNPSPYRIRQIYDKSSGKTRIISSPKFFPDQIIHWALMLQIQPIIMRGMYQYSCGSVPERGTTYGQKTLRKWLDEDVKGTKYCLKADIKQYFPSVDNEILKKMFRRKIKDRDCLWLIDIIIDSAKGLPIGNYTSQWFSNFYLEGLDHYIKSLGVKYYQRYVDDLVILGGNKRRLHKVKKLIGEYLESIKLELKDNWQVFKTSSRPIDYLGLKFYPDRTTLRGRNFIRMRRRFVKIGKKKYLTFRDACATVSYWGWIKRSNSFGFYNKEVKPKIDLPKARKVISYYGKKNSLLRKTRI